MSAHSLKKRLQNSQEIKNKNKNLSNFPTKGHKVSTPLICMQEEASWIIKLMPESHSEEEITL